MKYTKEEVMQYVDMEDVRFIRLAFCDLFGRQKNAAIIPTELERAFRYGIGIDATAITGFGKNVSSDLILHPDPASLSSIPWRSENGRVIRMQCAFSYPDGTPFDGDSRSILKKAVQDAADQGITFDFGPKTEFYLFKTDENGAPTKEPYDQAGYMDLAPEDKGENIRREICLTLSQMGIHPESSHHEVGPGQNEIDFRYSDPVSAADNTLTFATVVRTIAARNGLFADFSPRPLPDAPGSGFHITISVHDTHGRDVLPQVIAGIMAQIRDITIFLNPIANSYERLGSYKAPAYVSWSSENRSQLLRIPMAPGRSPRVELRSPDPSSNPYIAFALLIYAGLYGIEHELTLPDSTDINLATASAEIQAQYEKLPSTLAEAAQLARNSAFVREHLSERIIDAYCNPQ